MLQLVGNPGPTGDVIGRNLTRVISVDVGSVLAKFRRGSGTHLITEVPSAAIDSLVSVTLATACKSKASSLVHIPDDRQPRSFDRPRGHAGFHRGRRIRGNDAGQRGHPQWLRQKQRDVHRQLKRCGASFG